MGHLSSALHHHTSYIFSAPAAFTSWDTACTAWAVHLESSRLPPQPYTLGAWQGPSFLYTTVSLVLSNPSFRTGSLQLYKMHPHTHTRFWLLLFFRWYRTAFCFTSFFWFAVFILPFWAHFCSMLGIFVVLYSCDSGIHYYYIRGTHARYRRSVVKNAFNPKTGAWIFAEFWAADKTKLSVFTLIAGKFCRLPVLHGVDAKSSLFTGGTPLPSWAGAESMEKLAAAIP